MEPSKKIAELSEAVQSEPSSASPQAKNRKIIHVDMDCFYAAVEVKYQPHLKGKPIGVGGPAHTRSVLTTASYEARAFGVRSAMPSSQAVRLCPDLILIPPNFERYKKESQRVRRILEDLTPIIEPLSLDEAYLDVTDCPHFNGSATLIAQEIRRRIFSETGLTASAGIGPNKFIAKVASDWNKPNGQFVVTPDQVPEFVKALKVEKIFGVGKVTAKKMHGLGIKTCADLQKFSVFDLSVHFGSWARSLYNLARGLDDRDVETFREPKSLSVEETFNKDVTTLTQALTYVPALYQDWLKRIEKKDLRERIRTHSVKLKYFDFKSTTLERSSKELPTEESFSDLVTLAWQRRNCPIRLLGVGVKLATPEDSVDPTQLTFDL